jgi:hypothetical protein
MLATYVTNVVSRKQKIQSIKDRQGLDNLFLGRVRARMSSKNFICNNEHGSF